MRPSRSDYTGSIRLHDQLTDGARPSSEQAQLEARLKIKPYDLGARVALGILQARAGNEEHAIDSFRAALELDPHLPEAHFNLANLLRRAGRLTEAVAHYQNVLSIRPNHVGALNNLGALLRGQDQWADAEAMFTRATKAMPTSVESHVNLAVAAQAQGKLDNADRAYATALKLDPNPALRFRRAMMLPPIVEAAATIDDLRTRMRGNLGALIDDAPVIEDPLHDCDWTNFYLAYHGLDDRPIQEQVARFFISACPSLTENRVRNRRPLQGRRLRLGMISAYFYDHTIGALFKDAIKALRHEPIELFLFQIGAADDPVANEIARSAEHYTVLPRNLARMRDIVSDAHLDVLFFPEIGMDPATYFLAYARLAPVQVMGWGHPVTSGIPNIDVMISAPIFERADADKDYSEHLIRLPWLFLKFPYPEVARDAKSRADLGLPTNGRLYLCPQSLFKLHPSFDAILADILRRDPAARICLLKGHRAHWQTLLTARINKSHGDVADRIVFAPNLSRDDFVRAQAAADVVLDTPHFCGGKTSLECLAAGTPTVTLPGRYLRGRLTYGFYARMGVMDAIATSAENYAQRAVQLASDRDLGRQVRDQIRATVPGLFDDNDAVTSFVESMTALAIEKREENKG